MNLVRAGCLPIQLRFQDFADGGLKLFDVGTDFGPQRVMRLLKRDEASSKLGQVGRPGVHVATGQLRANRDFAPRKEPEYSHSQCAERAEQNGGDGPVHVKVEG